MNEEDILEKTASDGRSDEDIVERIKAGDTALFEIIMRRYNQRLYRVARSILHDDAESEDVMQDAYVRAYQHLDQFAGLAPFSAWLTRIAVHEALSRVRLRQRNLQLDGDDEDGELRMNMAETPLDPEQHASRAELGHLLEEALLGLPVRLRTVVMLRDVEELSTAETAEVLDISEDNVKVRLHRGRAMARDWLYTRAGANGKDAFPFMGERCDLVVRNVFSKLNL
jgi:RNA polymerase sigma-70 factor, ECF subfamily